MHCLTLKYYIQNNEYVVLWLKHIYVFICLPYHIFHKKVPFKGFFCCYKSRKSYTIVLKLKMSQYWSHKLYVRTSGGKKTNPKQTKPKNKPKRFLSNKNDLGMLSNAWDIKREIRYASPCSKTSSPSKRYTGDVHTPLTMCWGTSLLQFQPRRFGGIFPSQVLFGPRFAWLRWRLQTWQTTTAPKLSHCERDEGHGYITPLQTWLFV